MSYKSPTARMSPQVIPFILGCIVLFAARTASVRSEDWTNWRGPGMRGVIEEGDYPVTWDTSKNIAWKFPLPGRGTSTPMVLGDRIFLTYLKEDKNCVLCLDRTGKQLWEKEAGIGVAGKHRKGTGANPSMATDGALVFAMFKSGDLVAIQASTGETQWHKNLQKELTEDTLWWDLGASPIFADGKLIVTCQQSGPSYIAAFAPSTGDLLWKVDRILPAPNESNQSYTTPILVPAVPNPSATAGKGSSDAQFLVLGGADHVTAHSLEDGKEIWRVGGLNPEQHEMFRSIASPVADGEYVYFPYARGETLTAIRLGGHGDVTDSHVAWMTDEISSDVPTPAAFDGKLYVLQDKGSVACLDGRTGKILWRATIGDSNEVFSASPILVKDRLYATREDGTTFVLDIKNGGKILSENPLEEGLFATPVFVDGMILMRTFDNVFCIQDPS
jgi:outer membrane protein assembly factor BamB